ncbi:MAG: phosphoesterase [Planctomycetia bacterium]|nr:phosphoesterase [Planctomycetia bacterium]
MSKKEEQILVVPTSLFHQLGHFQGFSTNVELYQKTLLAPENISARPRGEMETNPNFKQLIPYMIFCYTDSQNGETSIFTYIRGKGQGEKRLHSKMSLGIGGHLNVQDFDQSEKMSCRNFYEEGKNRELHEEVQIESQWTESCVGLINDDENEVGKVHLGIVHRFDLVQPKMQANETELVESGFRSVQELLTFPEDQFESWSAICLNALFRKR